MVQKNVIPFRKRLYAAALPRRRWGAPAIGPTPILVAVVAVSLLCLAALYSPPGVELNAGAASARFVSVSWVDGDSGTIDGQKFRLHGVDAPERSPSRAGCAYERVLAERAKDAARRLTNGSSVAVRQTYGPDRYGRELVDLSLEGRDVAGALITAGHLRRWNFERGDPAPEWCE